MSESYHAIKQLIQSSAFSQALSLTESSLKESPNDIELLYMKAVTQRLLAQYSQAINTLNRLLAIKPTYARAHQEAGYCYLAMSDKEPAKKAFHTATLANPALLSAWKTLHELAPDNSEVSRQMAHLEALPQALLAAMDLIYEGKYAVAEKLCRQYLQKNKHHPEAMCLLAEIGIKTKVYDDAAFLLESCIELHPAFDRAKLIWADLLNTLGQHARALEVAQAYSQQHPSSTLAKMALASALVGVGKLEEGIAVYEGVLTNEPDRAGVHLQKGHALKAQGKLEEAVGCYKKAYELKPGYGDAYWSLANTKTYRFCDEETVTMKQYADQSLSTSLDRVQFCFALGKAYEDAKDYKTAFDYYSMGNRLKSESVGYDADTNTKLVDLQIQHCTAELFEKRCSGHPSSAPLFIVGLPRAGSTLIEQILSSHSQVDATMELHSILGIAMRLRGRMTNDEPAYPANLHRLSNDQLTQLGKKFMDETKHYRQGAPFFIDKMPNNFMHIGLIKCILPNAKIIDARRHPMACCFSGYKQLFGEGQEFSYDLVSMARYYKDYVRLMAHWDKVLPGTVLKVQHEDVINDLEGQVRRLLDFCELPFEQSCIDFHLNKRAIKTPSSEQVRQPINRDGMEQWKHFSDFLTPLKRELGDLLITG